MAKNRNQNRDRGRPAARDTAPTRRRSDRPAGHREAPPPSAGSAMNQDPAAQAEEEVRPQLTDAVHRLGHSGAGRRAPAGGRPMRRFRGRRLAQRRRSPVGPSDSEQTMPESLPGFRPRIRHGVAHCGLWRGVSG